MVVSLSAGDVTEKRQDKRGKRTRRIVRKVLCGAPLRFLLTENLGRLVEELLGGGALLAELLGHADGLSALTGEEESLLGGVIGRLHHRAGTGGAADGLSVFYWCDLCGGGRVSG